MMFCSLTTLNSCSYFNIFFSFYSAYYQNFGNSVDVKEKPQTKNACTNKHAYNKMHDRA